MSVKMLNAYTIIHRDKQLQRQGSLKPENVYSVDTNQEMMVRFKMDKNTGNVEIRGVIFGILSTCWRAL